VLQSVINVSFPARKALGDRPPFSSGHRPSQLTVHYLIAVRLHRIICPVRDGLLSKCNDARPPPVKKKKGLRAMKIPQPLLFDGACSTAKKQDPGSADLHGP